MKNGAAGGYFGDSTLGGKLMTWDGRQYYLFYSGMNVSNQANFYMQLCLPPEMEVGESINVRNNGLIGIEDGGTVTIGGTTFQNCLKVTISRSVPDDSYISGTGYLLLAPNIGIVKIEFTRAAGTDSWANKKVMYELLETTTFQPHSISGTVTTDGTTPAQDVYVQIATAPLDGTAITDVSGNFTLNGIYGPDMRLFFGYNGHDNRPEWLDFDYPGINYPRLSRIEGIADDKTGLNFNLSTLSW